MADTTIKDSPVSHLSAVTELSANDLFLVSKAKLKPDGEISSFTSNKVTFNDAVSSFIDYSTGALSAYFQSKLSVFTGTVTLTEWEYRAGS